MVGTEVDPTFRQDLQDLHDFLLHFQFPDETENTQSPPANKIGKYNLVIKEVVFNRDETSSAKQLIS